MARHQDDAAPITGSYSPGERMHTLFHRLNVEIILISVGYIPVPSIHGGTTVLCNQIFMATYVG